VLNETASRPDGGVRAFWQEEADNWFKRNCAALGKAPADDKILGRLGAIGIAGKKVLEIGAANGWRIAALVRLGAAAIGIEPSAMAIEDGRRRFPGIRLEPGVGHDLSLFADGEFDVVYLSYVLHWIERRRLMQTASEIDRVLKDGGWLLIDDFCPDLPHRLLYHHRTDIKLFTYKQDYAGIFTGANLYRLEERVIYAYGNQCRTGETVAVGHESAALEILRKTTHGRYPLRDASDSRSSRSTR
jgi:SAM-dependent methyltransferase